GDLDPIDTGTDETIGGIGSGDGIGGPGNNENSAGGAGDDALNGGGSGNSEPIVAIPGVDAVRFGSEIGAGSFSVSLGGDGHAFDIGTDPFSALWQLEQGFQVGNLVLSSGATWDAQYFRDNLRLGVPLDPRHDDIFGHGQRLDPDSNLANSSNKHDQDRGDGKDQQDRDRIAGLLHAYLAEKSPYDFETHDTQLEQGGRRQDVLTPQDIAKRWQLVGQYVNGLSDTRDEDARQGTGELFAVNALNFLGGSGFGAAFGHAGSTGATRGFANLRTLKGLDEGMTLLRS